MKSYMVSQVLGCDSFLKFKLRHTILCGTMADLPSLRREQVQTLRRFAGTYAVTRVADNASRAKVQQMVEALLACPGMSTDDKANVKVAWQTYRDSFPQGSFEEGAEQQPAAVQPLPAVAQTGVQDWKFQAAQLTYNKSNEEWDCTDTEVLRALLMRLVLFIQTALQPWQPKGISATIEKSTASANQRHHAHVYFHLGKLFHRRSLECFEFEGTCPHVEPNKCSGNTYQGAVNRGHLYVHMDKIGSVLSWTNYAPFKSYAVEGWWLDQWLKAGKLDRPTSKKGIPHFPDYFRSSFLVRVGKYRRCAEVCVRYKIADTV